MVTALRRRHYYHALGFCLKGSCFYMRLWKLWKAITLWCEISILKAGRSVMGAFFPQGLPELVQDGAQVRTGVPLLALWPQKLSELSP